jgi:hypothetical protein
VLKIVRSPFADEDVERIALVAKIPIPLDLRDWFTRVGALKIALDLPDGTTISCFWTPEEILDWIEESDLVGEGVVPFAQDLSGDVYFLQAGVIKCLEYDPVEKVVSSNVAFGDWIRGLVPVEGKSAENWPLVLARWRQDANAAG